MLQAIWYLHEHEMLRRSSNAGRSPQVQQREQWHLQQAASHRARRRTLRCWLGDRLVRAGEALSGSGQGYARE